jgi:hypothetical protein
MQNLSAGKTLACLMVLLLQNVACLQAQNLPKLQISENKHYLADEKGNFFPWIGDTGWGAVERLTREEMEEYLEVRKSQGFTVIHITLLSVTPGSMAPNVYGDSACAGGDISLPKVTPGNDPADTAAYDFWDHADYFFTKAAEKGLYVATCLMWGKDLKKLPPAEHFRQFGEWVGNRYKDQSNIIWLTLGEGFHLENTNPPHSHALAAIEGIRKGDTGHKLLTLHPHPRTGTSLALHHAVDFHSWQSGQGFDPLLVNGKKVWEALTEDWHRKPAKPVADMEATYEGLPPFWEPDKPRRNAWHIRVRSYLSVFAGGFGHSYGANGVWDFQLYYPQLTWQQALQLEGAYDMQHLKDLLVRHDPLQRIPDTSLIVSGQSPDYSARVQACRAADGSYVLIYIADGHAITVDMQALKGRKITARWFSPRDGSYHPIGRFKKMNTQQFTPPGTAGPDNDWVLVLSHK